MFKNHAETIKIGNGIIGGGSPVLIQSMCNTKTEDISATMNQIHRLEQASYDVTRIAIPIMEATRALSRVRKEIHIPLVADIHFGYRLTIASIENGADKIRINPGSIGGHEKAETVVDKVREHGTPIRVGVNSGPLEKSLLKKYSGVTVEGIVENVPGKVRLIKDVGYDSLVISIKSSNMITCVKAHELIVSRTGYPLRVGITESGTLSSGNIKSSVDLGIILHQGIGDTIGVSLIGDPVKEVKSAKLIPHTLGLRSGGIGVVSCPTRDHTRIDLIGLVNQVETMVSGFGDLNVKVAAMGRVINGPGKAREVDIGIVSGVGEGLPVKKKEIVRKVSKAELLPVLRLELESIRP